MARFFKIDDARIINLDLVSELEWRPAGVDSSLRKLCELVITLATPDAKELDRCAIARQIVLPAGPVAGRLWAHVSHVAEDNLKPID